MLKHSNRLFLFLCEKLFHVALWASVGIILLLVLYILFILVHGSQEAFQHFGVFDFIFTSDWDPTSGKENYGALSFIVGTLSTSTIALLLAIPFSLPVALFLGEYFRGKTIASILSAIVDMLAGVPSIVFGLWGYYSIRPLIIEWGWSQQGSSVFLAGFVLAIMIIPYATSLSAEFIAMVSNELKEAAYAMGATRFEMIRHVLFSSAGSGIFASFILALGRALGETMAVTMLIGNTSQLPGSIWDTADSMASVIANQFGEADGLKLSSLIALALLLFLLTALVNGAGRLIMKKIQGS